MNEQLRRNVSTSPVSTTASQHVARERDGASHPGPTRRPSPEQLGAGPGGTSAAKTNRRVQPLRPAGSGGQHREPLRSRIPPGRCHGSPHERLAASPGKCLGKVLCRSRDMVRGRDRLLLSRFADAGTCGSTLLPLFRNVARPATVFFNPCSSRRTSPRRTLVPSVGTRRELTGQPAMETLTAWLPETLDRTGLLPLPPSGFRPHELGWPGSCPHVCLTCWWRFGRSVPSGLRGAAPKSSGADSLAFPQATLLVAWLPLGVLAGRPILRAAPVLNRLRLALLDCFQSSQASRGC